MLAMASLPEPTFSRGHRPTLTATSVSTMGSLSIPRIRILLAPYMSPYVIPLKKVETWELLLNLLSNLFGPSILTSILQIKDTNGNVIHRHVWEDLLEPGMTIVVDTGSSFNSRPGEENIANDERRNEKERTKQIQAALPFGQPPDPLTAITESSPKQNQYQDLIIGGSKITQQKGKLPDAVIEQWSNHRPKSPAAEDKRITTVSMFIQHGMNGSRVTLGQMNVDGKMGKMGIFEERQIVQREETETADKTPMHLKRKKSTVARVADCFHGIKSRYGNSIPRDGGVSNSRPAITTEIAANSQKEKQAREPPPRMRGGTTQPQMIYTATASGAISNQPIKPAKRTASLKAFFRYFEEDKPVQVPRRTKSTPATPAGSNAKQSLSSSNEIAQRPTTAPQVTTISKSPALRQRGNTGDNSGYTSDGASVATGLQHRGTRERIEAPVPAASPVPIISMPPIIDKPLPKLPYKFSTFPAPTPPRSPLIKASVRLPQPQTQIQAPSIAQQLQSLTAPTPPPPTNKIIPWDELNRRLAKETQATTVGAKLRKASVSAGISHRRGRSADSGYSYHDSLSIPLSFGVSRPTTAVVENAEVAINGFGMKSKLISVGKPGPQAAESSKPRKTLAPGKVVRRVASDDTIRSGAGSWRLGEHRRPEIRWLQKTAARKDNGVGLGIDIPEESPRLNTLQVKGGKTIAIGVIPED